MSLCFPSWLRDLIPGRSRPRAGHGRRQPHRFRPGLEALEERAVPASFNVTTTVDGGAGSLRQAILDANDRPGADTGTFDPTVFGTDQTITLTGGELPLTGTSGATTLLGPVTSKLTVSGNNASRVFNIASD